MDLILCIRQCKKSWAADEVEWKYVMIYYRHVIEKDSQLEGKKGVYVVASSLIATLNHEYIYHIE